MTLPLIGATEEQAASLRKWGEAEGRAQQGMVEMRSVR